MKTWLVALVALAIGLAAGFALDHLFAVESARWSQQREMRGCWASGANELLVKQGDRRLRFLEARVGGRWIRLATRAEGEQLIASPQEGAGTLTLSPEADQLVSRAFLTLPDAEWMRCEVTKEHP